MKLVTNLHAIPAPLTQGAVTVGNFDGVHRGHAAIVSRLLSMAKEVGGPATVFTFDPHPVRLLRPESAPPPLTWTDRKSQLLEQLGIDLLVVYPTDESLLQMSATDFFHSVLQGKLNLKGIVEGENFRFGKGRSGNVDTLLRLAQETKIPCEVVPPLLIEGDIVSSSRIRNLIAGGNVELAGKLLTCPYRIRGIVVHGAQRGARLGFPTANLDGIDTLIPSHGVYAGRAYLDSVVWPAAIHLGPSPTFGEKVGRVEIHLIGYSGNLYGQTLEVEFLKRLRDLVAFDSVDALREQLTKDVAQAVQHQQ